MMGCVKVSTTAPEIDLDKLDFLKVEEVVEIMNVSRRTVEELIYSGELRSYRIRGNRRVDRADLVTYLLAVRSDATSPAPQQNRRSA